jgi:hypothetical protein
MGLRRLSLLVAVTVLALPSSALAAQRSSKDRDHDHMPDKWEQKYGLDTHRNDAKADKDHDGLSNLAEYRVGSNPRKVDSDGDGVSDNWEVVNGYDPTDPGDDPATEACGANDITDNGDEAAVASGNASPTPDPCLDPSNGNGTAPWL